MVFRPLQIVAESTRLLVFAVLMEALSIYVMTVRTEKVGADPPDIWFGCQEDKLFNYLELEEIGSTGRQAYISVNQWDFFPYMPSYMILLGALLIFICQCRSGVSKELSWISPTIMGFDVIESSIFGYATTTFPTRINPLIISIASIANQLKWVSFATAILLLVGLFVRSILKHGNKLHQK